MPESVRPGSLVTHTLVVSNTGPASAADARIAWLLPWNTAPLAASWSGSGAITLTGDVIRWQGALAVGESVTLTHSARAPRSLVAQFQLSEALLWDGAGGMWERSAWQAVTPYPIYLPLALRAAN
jgi:uncharacterized repeat protein (TIGR01451 family)